MPLRLTSVSADLYRSIRRIQVPVERLTVLVGKNGVGKTNLYRSLELLAAAARGTITREIAEEGGFESVLWAGPRAKGPVRLKLGAEFGEYFYSIEIGLPAPIDEAALTKTEPMVKAEELVHRSHGKAVTLMKRQGPSAWLRDESGRRQSYEEALVPSETALSGFRDQGRFTELDLVRRALQDWRFYHDFRTDKASPIRQPALAITTPTLASDGYDLAAALATVFEIRGEAPDIEAAIADAFPGTALITEFGKGTVSIGLQFPDLPRPLGAHELSDGTLHFLCLVAALSAYRLPGFIALNEPETSLHPELIPALARLIVRAAERTQVWVVTHSEALATALGEEAGVAPRVVVKQDGATWIEGLKLFGEFADQE
ncbi:ATPase [Kaistia sp. 32K]|uniref:AAA family ATPase n=1 Tax=Kaistia sp. 32K TaxID=2795690 RepID=UPI001915DB4F|nr:AAA family ATPase [Kaistia sp. 32K]BCP54104.1 ATPase [Kaistia sp. 32K]